MIAVAVIPARYASTRFPGKPLANQTGKALIEHVYDQVRRSRRVDRVLVATDDERIAAAVRGFGGQAVMTRPNHPSGTDRVAEVAASLDCDAIVNVQGDEPELESESIDRLLELLKADADLPMATLACPFSRLAHADPSNPAAVKVAVSNAGRALYFSRSLIPYQRTPGAAEPYLHLGIYAYRRDFLLRLAQMPPTPLERAEGLEQLRVLENGFAIGVGIVDRAAVGIDTPEDYAAFVARWNALQGQSRPLTSEVDHAR